MSWASGLIHMFKNKKVDESQFIVGIDLGDATSSICYFDAARNTPEIIDISGGYGRANVPTTVQYIPDTKEWIFGEYALLNKGMGNDITFSSLINRLGTKAYVEIDNKLESIISVLSLYLKELLGSCKNINPKAEISGIVVCVPSYMPNEAKEELLRAFALIGYDKKVIDFVSDRECVMTYHFFNKKIEREKILVLDYGSRELRGGIYDIKQEDGSIKLKTLSYLFDDLAGTNVIDKRIFETFTDYYVKNTKTPKGRISKQILEQIGTFAYQHKDVIFQRGIFSKGVRLYFNFAYPPFYEVLEKAGVEELIKPFKERFYDFFENLLKNNIESGENPVEASDITTVLCTGGGFEMLWAREAVEDIFPDSHIFQYKNSKAVGAYGASIIAAGKLGVIAEREFEFEDTLQVTGDIGIYIMKDNKKKFITIIERNSFWWQNKNKFKLIVNEKTDKPFAIELFKRDDNGMMKIIGVLTINGVPQRPRGATKLDLQLEYTNRSTLKATVTDRGFGEFFTSSGYNEKFFMNVTM